MNEREKNNRRRGHIPLRRTSSLAWSPFCMNLSLSISIESLTSGMSLASDKFETRPSLRPVGTSYAGPFACIWWIDQNGEVYKERSEGFHVFFFVTKDIASRAAKATMSAHETTPGHAASTSALTASIISNPLTPSCPNANFSEIAPLSTRIEPSHPWKCVLKTSEGKQWRRRKVALYLDKAIVKMEAEKYGWEVWVGKRSSRDNSFDDWLGLRACIGVKPDFEISNRDAEENYDQRQS